MWGRKIIVQALAVMSFVSVGNASDIKSISYPELKTDFIASGKDSTKTKGKSKGKDSNKKTEAKATADANANGVTITQSAPEPHPLDNLKIDEVYVEPTQVKREIVLEEDFKLWRINVQKGRKVTEYRKVEVPFGIYYKKNDLDITEEVYNLETKDIPEGETKRYMRDEYEKKEKERIAEEIRQHFQIKTIPLDSISVPPPAEEPQR